MLVCIIYKNKVIVTLIINVLLRNFNVSLRTTTLLFSLNYKVCCPLSLLFLFKTIAMTKTLVAIDQWNRKDHYNFFSKFDEPFFGITVNVDCTMAYKKAKESKTSFFLYYLYRALKAANQVENFRYRIIDDKVYLFDVINASPTINRPDNTFGFSFLNYNEDENSFRSNALEVIKKVQESKSLFPEGEDKINVIHFSALPWLNFTSMSHARNYKYPDSCPKISFGKVTEINNTKTMAISIHAHHGLVDGYHVGLFVEKFQALLNE